MKAWLEDAFPELRGRVTGGNSPVPPLVELSLKLIGLLQFLGIVFVVTGEGVFQFFGMQRAPAWYRDVVMKNGVPIMICVYLVVPQFLNGFLVSGAFEVILDGKDVIFSKLATNRMPGAEDIIAPLTKAGLSYVAKA